MASQHAIADTMRLVSAFKVEEDLQRAWREEREREIYSKVECVSENRKVRLEKKVLETFDFDLLGFT
jgi:hypothetical protein